MGIGGIFFQCDDFKVMWEWYIEYFGLKIDEYGVFFEFCKVLDFM